MSKLTLVLLAMGIIALGHARHVHPHHKGRSADDETQNTALPEIDGMSIETIRNIRPSHFVPINNILFFRRYEPCGEGLERDLFGVCREVWD